MPVRFATEGDQSQQGHLLLLIIESWDPGIQGWRDRKGENSTVHGTSVNLGAAPEVVSASGRSLQAHRRCRSFLGQSSAKRPLVVVY